MERPNPQVRKSVRELIDKLHADHVREMDGACVGWIVMSLDEECRSLYFTGPFDTREEAEYESVRQGEAMNDDLGEDEPGWHLTVHRLMPSSRPRSTP